MNSSTSATTRSSCNSPTVSSSPVGASGMTTPLKALFRTPLNINNHQSGSSGMTGKASLSSTGSSSQSSSVSSPPSSAEKPGKTGSSPGKSRFSTVLVPESPRRASLFSTFKVGLKGKKGGDTSPRDSPTGNHFMPTLCEASSSQAAPIVSPRRYSLFDQLANFRQRSKSDSRSKKQMAKNENHHQHHYFGGETERSSHKLSNDSPLSVYATIHNGQRPPLLTTITSVEEERFCGRCAECSGGDNNSGEQQQLCGPGGEQRLDAEQGLSAEQQQQLLGVERQQLFGGSPNKRRQHRLSESGARPELPLLYVDTQLANSSPVSTQCTKQCCLSARNPNELNKEYEERRRFLSGSDNDRRMSLLIDATERSGRVAPSRHYSLDQRYFMDDDRNKKLIVFKEWALASGVDLLDAACVEHRALIFYHLLKVNRTFNVVPSTSRVVVFDTAMPVKKAFSALLSNSVRAAVLLDSRREHFIGMLSISDFIQILLLYESENLNPIAEFENNTIRQWKDRLAVADNSRKPFVHITSDSSLYAAVQLLLSYRIHRLPIVDKATGNVLYLMTYKRLLRYLFIYVVGIRPNFLLRVPRELGIGTYANIKTITSKSTLREALNIFMNDKVSALPLVDEENHVTDIYCKFDVLSVMDTKSYENLDIPMHQAIQQREQWKETEDMAQRPYYFEKLITCRSTDILWNVIETFILNEVHRLVVVDAKTLQLSGIISLSDLFRFFMMPQPKEGTPEDLDRPPTSQYVPPKPFMLPPFTPPPSPISPAADRQGATEEEDDVDDLVNKQPYMTKVID